MFFLFSCQLSEPYEGKSSAKCLQFYEILFRFIIWNSERLQLGVFLFESLWVSLFLLPLFLLDSSGSIENLQKSRTGLCDPRLLHKQPWPLSSWGRREGQRCGGYGLLQFEQSLILTGTSVSVSVKKTVYSKLLITVYIPIGIHKYPRPFWEDPLLGRKQNALIKFFYKSSLSYPPSPRAVVKCTV